MTTKLTLTVEKDIIESAKIYAKQNGRSLSPLIENYLNALVQKENPKDDLSPKVKELMGSIKLPKDFDYEKELTESLAQNILNDSLNPLQETPLLKKFYRTLVITININ